MNNFILYSPSQKYLKNKTERQVIYVFMLQNSVASSQLFYAALSVVVHSKLLVLRGSCCDDL